MGSGSLRGGHPLFLLPEAAWAWTGAAGCSGTLKSAEFVLGAFPLSWLTSPPHPAPCSPLCQKVPTPGPASPPGSRTRNKIALEQRAAVWLIPPAREEADVLVPFDRREH